MKSITIVLVLVIISSVCFGQKDDKAKLKTETTQATIQVATDSTALLTAKDIGVLAKYLEDKLLAKDYNLVLGALNQLLTERAKEYQKPKNK